MLTEWQQAHLRVSCYVHPTPWELEASVIDQLKPPLNLDLNEAHTFHATLKAARAQLRKDAGKA